MVEGHSADYAARPKITIGVYNRFSFGPLAEIVKVFSDTTRTKIEERTHYGARELVMEGVYVPELGSYADVIIYSVAESSWRRVPLSRYFDRNDSISNMHKKGLLAHVRRNIEVVGERNILDYVLSDEEHSGMTVYWLEGETVTPVGLPLRSLFIDFEEFVQQGDTRAVCQAYVLEGTTYKSVGTKASRESLADKMLIRLTQTERHIDFPYELIPKVTTSLARDRLKAQTLADDWGKTPSQDKRIISSLRPYVFEILLKSVLKPGEEPALHTSQVVDHYISNNLRAVIEDVGLGTESSMTRHIDLLKSRLGDPNILLV
jgi:hypothetical protein